MPLNWNKLQHFKSRLTNYPEFWSDVNFLDVWIPQLDTEESVTGSCYIRVLNKTNGNWKWQRKQDSNDWLFWMKNLWVSSRQARHLLPGTGKK